MGSFKVPCPNGFQAHFHQTKWHIDLKDVSKFTQTVFVTVIILHPLNHIQIILREFQLITSDSNNNFLLLDQDTNRFLVQVQIKRQISYTIIRDQNTQIILILTNNINSLELVTHFRPISLCNTSYKIITKIIVNRIKPYIATSIHATKINLSLQP